MQEVYRDIEARRDESVALLQRLCQQPSISAQKVGLREMATLLAGTMREFEIATTVFETAGNPIVFGEVKGESDKTLLFYNHYDVQPPEPLEKWDSPPFAAEVRDGRIYARGATDNKGNITSRLAAVRSLMNVRGKLPITVKFLIEGEEEIGSEHLEAFMAEHRDLLKADGCVWEDTVGRVDLPLVSYGNKGMAYVELRVRTANTDFHSSQAPIYPSAAWRLIWALGTLKGPDERVQIPGFYDALRPIGPEEQAVLDRMLPIDVDDRKRRFELSRMVGEAEHRDVSAEQYGRWLAARASEEPTCNVSGLNAGYTGEGSKTIVPGHAFAKLEMRLMVDQEAHDIVRKLRAHLDRQGFEDVEIELLHGHSRPSKYRIFCPLTDAITAATREVFGGDPILEPCGGGSTPMFLVDQYLGIDCASTGLGHVRANTHAPNESVAIDDLVGFAKWVATIIERF